MDNASHATKRMWEEMGKPKEERFIVKDGSNSGHCCFEYSVIDTYRKPFKYDDGGISEPYAVCECFYKQEAEEICRALNSIETKIEINGHHQTGRLGSTI